MKVINLQRVVFKDTWKSEVEKMTWQSILPKFNYNSKWYISSLCGPCVLVCMSGNMGACSWWWGRWCPGGYPPTSGPQRHWAPGQSEVQCGIEWTETWLDLGWAIMGASRWYDLLHSLGIACIQTATWGHALLCTFSSLHKGADAGAADGLGSFYDPVQLS